MVIKCFYKCIIILGIIICVYICDIFFIVDIFDLFLKVIFFIVKFKIDNMLFLYNDVMKICIYVYYN